jgi:hypothetical protein
LSRGKLFLVKNNWNNICRINKRQRGKGNTPSQFGFKSKLPRLLGHNYGHIDAAHVW